MDKQSRKKLIRQYKLQKVPMGVYQLRNKNNGKIFVEAINNLKSRELTLRGMLNEGRHPNHLLQQEWNGFGPEAFEYSVLEEVEADPNMDPAAKKRKLDTMKQRWLDEKAPYGENGYNSEKSAKEKNGWGLKAEG